MFCAKRYRENGCRTSKTIARQKGQKIRKIIRSLWDDPVAEAYSSKFWVKQRRFRLINCSLLDVKDGLCLKIVQA